MDVNERFTKQVILKMRRDVEEADGNEVFWSARINAEGKVVDATVGARGNEDSVIVNESAAREGNVLIHNHPSGTLRPSNADQSVAYNAQDVSLGFYIVNNDISQVYVVVEPIKPKILEKLNCDEAAFFLSKTGPLAAKNKSYEERPQQVALLREIASTFNSNSIGVFEAGTGVGKSFAYLVPSIMWAAKNKERVIISTGTINLQQQLFEKDIPAAMDITGQKLKAVLLKGRQNYLCQRRLSDANAEKDLFTEDSEMLETITKWAETTATGSRSDMTIVPPDSVWSRVNSESDACMGMRCPYRESCFVMKVRKEASDASIIVVNHHLLFADIESRMEGAGYDDVAVLPPYRRIVFDEAHGIEDSATSFFSESFTRFKVMKQINLLYRQTRGRAQGFLMQIGALTDVEDFIERGGEAVDNVKTSLMRLDEITQEIMDYDFTCRIHSQNVQRFELVFEAIGIFKSSLSTLVSLVREVLDNLSDEDKEIPQVWETKTVLRRLDGVLSLCKNFPEWDEHPDTVFWMQKVKLPPKKAGDDFVTFVQFVQTPLDVAPMMNQGVFEPMDSVVCTSATLRTGRNFSYWMNRTGISFAEASRIRQSVFESPFPYKTNVIFAVPNDAPFPDSPMYQSYVEQSVPELILAAKGRTLVLFTSYDMLRNTYYAVHSKLHSAGISMLKQGDDDRFRLLERFKSDNESVLFATDSFWEGVDVPGESLSQVIIVKLPFAVPSDPVFAARSESVEKRGGSSFFELSVPQAVIKFRQGFGRLMRRSDDRGVIVVLDRRIVEKSYGKQFTTSVPMTKRLYSPIPEICDAVEKILSK